MALTRRDDNGGAQLAGGFQPKYRGLLTSADRAFLKIHEDQDSAQRAADARRKLRTLAAKRDDDGGAESDSLCDTCQDQGQLVAYDAQGKLIGTVDCPDCDGSGGGGFSGSQA